MKIATNHAIFILLTTILAISAMVSGMQTAMAQGTPGLAIIRLVGGGATGGLIAISVNNIVVSDLIDIDRNNIAIPVTVPIDANIPITVCAIAVNVLGEITGPQSCRTVNNVGQGDIISVPLRQTTR